MAKRPSKGTILGNLGVVYQDLGQLQQAIAHHRQALVIHREVGDRRGESADTSNLGLIYSHFGQM